MVSSYITEDQEQLEWINERFPFFAGAIKPMDSDDRAAAMKMVSFSHAYISILKSLTPYICI